MDSKIAKVFKDHSNHYIEMALSWNRRERIDDPDAYGRRTGECGDTVEFFLRIKDKRIFRIFFNVDGCMNTAACANTVAVLCEGKTVDAAWDMKAEDVVAYLETLPSENHHCAELSVGAFYLALSDYTKNQRAPWKKVYRSPQPK